MQTRKSIVIGVAAALGVLVAIIIAASQTSNLVESSVSEPKSNEGIIFQSNSDGSSIEEAENRLESGIVNEQRFSPVTKRQSVVNKMFEVDAGGYVFYSFNAPRDASNEMLKGTFTSNKGINVFVIDGLVFDQWKGGRGVFTSGDVYYTTREYVNSGDINVRLYDRYSSVKGETLYLVFNNKEDTGSNKTVEADIELSYLIDEAQN